MAGDGLGCNARAPSPERAGEAERFLRNAWYQGAWSSEIGDAPLARTILNTPLVFYRTAGGRVAALLDRCPHRFAPLSRGVVRGDALVCGYHGLGFDADGRCSLDPHGPVLKGLGVAAFPVIERDEIVWIWLGVPDKADPDLVPDLAFISDAPAPARVTFHMPTDAHYELVLDNLMDLSHADFLHPGTFGKTVVGAKTRVYRQGSSVVAEWLNLGCEPPPFRRQDIPGEADFWIQVAWHAPGIIVLQQAAVPAGCERTAADIGRALHSLTPETSTRTHYFACGTGRGQLDSPERIAMRRTMLARAFMEEDKPMLEAQQRRIGTADFMSLGPVLLPIDAAAVQVRRALAGLIEAENLPG